ncbi:MAG: D-alanine--D-alanine ligase [Actinobacteria bacterium]|nr:D-alanine--D-alanine ligase [Actinomycetota bacterium]
MGPFWLACRTVGSVSVDVNAQAAANRDGVKHRIAIVFGGRNSEHGISCVSAGNVLAAIDRTAYEVVAVGIGRDGGWRLAPDDPQRYTIVDGVTPEVPTEGEQVMLAPDPTVGGLVTAAGTVIPIDVVFPVLHGAGGEDGAIQGVCELAGLGLVGSGVAASAVCMDKLRTKAAAAAAGIPTGDFVGITDYDWNHRREEVLERVEALGVPIFVKPARAGSSVGISKVVDAADAIAAIEHARSFDRRVIVEAAIVGAREIECGVLGTPSGPIVSECAEIEVLGDHEFYDFQAKYIDGSARTTVPARISDRDRETIRQLARSTFLALGCEGMARVDVFLLPDGTVLLNEPNSIPGFTSSSMYPVVWQAAGVDYPALIDALVADAVRRAARPEVSPG